MKKLTFVLILSLCAILVQSQTTAYLKVGNNGSFRTIEKVSSGGYITVGNDSAFKIQLIRWDENFNMLWKYKFTDPNIAAYFPKVIEANDGSFYFMTGSTEYTGSTLIVKLNAEGVLQWRKVYYLTSGTLNSIALSRATTGDNGFLFGGGQCTLYNFVIKCSSDGSIQWQKQYFYPLATGVITCWSVIPDGNQYVVSSGYNINSLLTFKLDALGNVTDQSAYTYSAMQIIPTRIVKLNVNSGYAILGQYNNSNNNKTQFVAFYNSGLDMLSFNELTVTYQQFTLNDITPINNGKNVIVDGSIYDNSAFTIAMINLSNTGSVVWKKRAAGNTSTSNKNVEFYGLTQNGSTTVHAGHGYNEGRVLAVIDSNGNGLCNDIAFNMTNVHPTLSLQTSTISPAAATVQVTNVSYIYTNSASFNKQIYCGNLSGIDDHAEPVSIGTTLSPNPAFDHCTLSFDESKIKGKGQLSLYDISGQLVYQSELTKGTSTKELDIRGYKEGLYLLQISSDEGIVGTGKMMVVR
jgi:hypothetical protein